VKIPFQLPIIEESKAILLSKENEAPKAVAAKRSIVCGSASSIYATSNFKLITDVEKKMPIALTLSGKDTQPRCVI